MIVDSIISYAVNLEQYVMVYTGAKQSATTGPFGLTDKAIAPPVFGHHAVYVFSLP